jgi:hypothetical protein
MPWHKQAMKDATTCEKRWGAGSKLRSVDIRMGQPNTSHVVLLPGEFINQRVLNLVK